MFLSISGDIKMGISDLFRRILLWFCDAVYSFIPGLYKSFKVLAGAQLFTAEDIQKFSNNIYVLISVIMLFAFGIKLIEAIVNPDLLGDTKKGAAGTFKRAIIALGLIVIIPYGFNKLYEVQSSFLDSNFFEKIILGNTNISTFANSECENQITGGQIIAGTALRQFLYPEDDSGTVIVTEKNEESAEQLNPIILCNVKKLSKIGSVINEREGDEYTFHFDGLFALATGIFLVYEFIILCIDTALRMVKLGFLQLIAPIIISAYIFTGTENLIKYFKEIGSTFAQVFIRIAAFSFYILILSRIEGVIDEIDSEAGKICIIFFLIGALQFVKIIPNLLGSIFGMNIQNKGGIKGRLGEMAGVGGMAQKAWGAVKGLSGAALAAPLAAAGFGLSKGIGFLGNRAANGINNLTKGKTEGWGHNFAGGLSAGKSMIKGAAGSGGFIKGISGAKKGLNENNFYKEKMFDRNANKDVKKHKKYNVDSATGKRKVPKDENGVGDTLEKVVNDQKTLMNDIKKDSKLNSTESSVTSKLIHDKNNKGKIDKVIKNMDSIESIVDRARTLSGDSDKAEKIQKAFADFKKNVNDKDALNNLKLQIKENASGTDADTVEVLANKASKLLKDNEIQTLQSGMSDISDLNNLVNIKAFSTNMDGIVKTSQAKFDDVKGRSSNANLMETYASIGEDLSNAYINQYSNEKHAGDSINVNPIPFDSYSSLDAKMKDVANNGNVTITPTNKAMTDDLVYNQMQDALSDIINNATYTTYGNEFSRVNIPKPSEPSSSQSQTNTGTSSSNNATNSGTTANNNTNNNTNNSGLNGTTASNTAGGTTVINNNYGTASSNSNMNNNDNVIDKLNEINDSINFGTAANVAATSASAQSIIDNDQEMARRKMNTDNKSNQKIADAIKESTSTWQDELEKLKDNKE